ncbi:hypothetical protein CHX26_09520 [Porphyrobacter sp. HT-58-2]|uniref:hypothetical protein n=1 Tax=Porphyrobacter sp. HT-58-2 TaxID=2023229 RepID=UPI000CDC60B1|nr:hypothetical protein [Porphyrobacter sp. HT-58-2]AUX69705.1 hypothetical protein CHX26_09520 [Porphyrobacter sp. HT-58-2]
MSAIFIKSGRTAILISATLAALILALSAPANAQGLLGRIGRALERIEQKTTEIENNAATLERSVTQVKQAADGIDRTVETAGALFSADGDGDDQADMPGDTGAMQTTEAWQAEEAAMMPGQPPAVEAADAVQPVPQDTVSPSKKEPRR